MDPGTDPRVQPSRARRSTMKKTNNQKAKQSKNLQIKTFIRQNEAEKDSGNLWRLPEQKGEKQSWSGTEKRPRHGNRHRSESSTVKNQRPQNKKIKKPNNQKPMIQNVYGRMNQKKIQGIYEGLQIRKKENRIKVERISAPCMDPNTDPRVQPSKAKSPQMKKQTTKKPSKQRSQA